MLKCYFKLTKLRQCYDSFNSYVTMHPQMFWDCEYYSAGFLLNTEPIKKQFGCALSLTFEAHVMLNDHVILNEIFTLSYK